MNHFLTLNAPYSPINLVKKISLKSILFTLAGVCFLALASQASIPLKPIPLTLQSAAVILLSMTFGARYGTTVVITYLIAGAAGIPVFANFSTGLTTLYTNGYLIGFIPAAFITGYLSEKGFTSNTLRAFLTACIGVSLIFVCGVSVLATLIGWHAAIATGFIPFIVSEPLKLLAVSLLVSKKPIRDSNGS